MKKFILFFTLLFSIATFSQSIDPQGSENRAFEYKGGVLIQKGFVLPKASNSALYPNLPSLGRIRTSNDSLIEYNNGNLYRKLQNTLGLKSPEDYGAIGNGINDDTQAIKKCFLLNNKVALIGNYVTSDDVIIRDGMTIHSFNASIKRTTTVTTPSNNATLVGAFSGNFKLIGNLTLKGSGKANGSFIGLYLAGCYAFHIDGLTVEDIAGDGIRFAGGSSSARGDRGVLSNLNVRNNWRGIAWTQADEYHSVTNLNASGNHLGVYINSGNVNITSGSITDNDRGVMLEGLLVPDNHLHGILNGLAINHNTVYNLYALNCKFGETINACHFYGTPTENIVLQNSNAINLNSCVIDGALDAYNDVGVTQTGKIAVTNCFFGPQISLTHGDQLLAIKDCYDIGNTGTPTEFSALNNQTAVVINDMQSAKFLRSGFWYSSISSPANSPFATGAYASGIMLSAAYDQNTSFASWLGTDIEGNWWANRKYVDVWQTPKKLVFDTDAVLQYSNQSISGTKTFADIKVSVQGTDPDDLVRYDQVQKVIRQTETIDFPDLGSGNQAAFSVPFTVSGADIGDEVSIIPPVSLMSAGSSENLIFEAYVSASNTVTAKVHKYTTGALTIPSASFNIIVKK